MKAATGARGGEGVGAKHLRERLGAVQLVGRDEKAAPRDQEDAAGRRALLLLAVLLTLWLAVVVLDGLLGVRRQRELAGARRRQAGGLRARRARAWARGQGGGDAKWLGSGATSSPTSVLFCARVRVDGGPEAPSATLSLYTASDSAPMRHSHSHVLNLASYPAHLTS